MEVPRRGMAYSCANKNRKERTVVAYYKLTDNQAVKVAQQIIDYDKRRALRTFLDELFGPSTFIVDIQVTRSQHGDYVQEVLVYNPDGKRVIPNLELAGWKDYLSEDNDVFDPHAGEEDQLTNIADYMIQHNVYLDYGIHALQEEGIRIEPGDPPHPPDLYLLP
jgi:hypothetical protein